MARTLSKSRFQKGLQCEKALWLKVHRGDLAADVTESQQWIFDQGHEVGMLARKLFPGGAEVAEDHFHSAEALATTARLIGEGATVLYEPAFESGGVFARVDILVAAGDGTWDLYEVKSGTALKDVYVTDAAVQAYAVEGAGLPLRSVNVIRVDTSYVYDGVEYDPTGIFAIEDVTGLARAYAASVQGIVSSLQDVLEGTEPVIPVGDRCSQPYSCEFKAYCHSFLPAEYPITQLPRLGERTLHALIAAGHLSLLDVPEDFPGLTLAHRESIAAAKAGEPSVDVDRLEEALNGLTWPVYHLDFETIAPALPLWAGTRPYQSVPFQYSVHVHYADGSTKHRQYLHSAQGDPRRRLARHLLADLGRRGSVVHYTAYERTQISGLAAALPDLASSLGNVSKRLVDLEPIIRSTTRHPRSAGRSSIKYVLPAWCPDTSYAELAIGDGQTASARYLGVLKGRIAPGDAEQVLADLREYCALDTYAMVLLLDRMRGLAEQARPHAGQ